MTQLSNQPQNSDFLSAKLATRAETFSRISCHHFFRCHDDNQTSLFGNDRGFRLIGFYLLATAFIAHRLARQQISTRSPTEPVCLCLRDSIIQEISAKMKKKSHLATDHGNLRLSQTQINNRVETSQLHSYESMHVIVESCFAALRLSVLINFDNEIIIFEKTKTKKLFYGTTNLNLQDKSIVDHAKAICSRNS